MNYSGNVNVVELNNINQRYSKGKDGDIVLFDNFSLSLIDAPNRGQYISIMGESGCGKSTLLRYIAGLQTPDSGEITVLGKKVGSFPIPMISQIHEPSYLPWKTVLDNVSLPLILSGHSLKESREKAMEIIQLVGLEKHVSKFCKPPSLSGGQLQRVAIARSLVANPSIILMDEPFSALDTLNRKKLQDFMIELFIKAEKADLNPTFIMVTHDEREAIYLSTEIFVMDSNPGRIKEHIIVPFLHEERNKALRHTQQFSDSVEYLEGLIERR